jgi:hypothetical protein
MGKRRGGENTYLNHLQRPSLDIPLSLRNTADIIIDKQALALYAQDQAIGNLPYIGHQLRDGFGKKVVEEVHSLDDDLMRVGGRVRSTSAPRRRRPRSGSLGRCVRGLRVLRRHIGARRTCSWRRSRSTLRGSGRSRWSGGGSVFVAEIRFRGGLFVWLFRCDGGLDGGGMCGGDGSCRSCTSRTGIWVETFAAPKTAVCG